MNRQNLEADYINMRLATLDPGSKWYADDVAHAAKTARTKSTTDLALIVGRMRAENAISDAEINAHCQFDGLFRKAR